MTLGRVERGVTEAGEEVWILPRGTPVMAGLDRMFAWITHTTNDGKSPQRVVVADERARRAPSSARRTYSRTVQRCTAREAFLTVSEVAATLAFCDETVRRLLRRKALDGRKVGRYWRVSESSVAHYLEADVAEVLIQETAEPQVDHVQAARTRFRKLRERGRQA